MRRSETPAWGGPLPSYALDPLLNPPVVLLLNGLRGWRRLQKLVDDRDGLIQVFP